MAKYWPLECLLVSNMDMQLCSQNSSLNSGYTKFDAEALLGILRGNPFQFYAFYIVASNSVFAKFARKARPVHV